MKSLNVVFKMITVYLIGLALLFFVLSLASCSSSRWYTRAHDGCQQSAGFGGYGNK